MKKIGVIGIGFVGSPVKRWFELQKNCEVFVYDKFKNLGSPEEVGRADIIFIAVPTPFREEGGYDDSALWEVLELVPSGKTVVIKSTILPGATDAFQKKHGEKIILHNPEFLTAKTAEEDFMHPKLQIVGYADECGRSAAEEVMCLLPKAPFSKIIKAREAEMVKYFINTHLAARVIFANQMYDLMEKIGGIDYEAVKECVAHDPRIGGSHFDVFHGGYRGYGGACLPKDTKTIINFARQKKTPLELVEKVDEINNKLWGPR